jgi:hypothetical protein
MTGKPPALKRLFANWSQPSVRNPRLSSMNGEPGSSFGGDHGSIAKRKAGAVDSVACREEHWHEGAD